MIGKIILIYLIDKCLLFRIVENINDLVEKSKWNKDMNIEVIERNINDKKIYKSWLILVFICEIKIYFYLINWKIFKRWRVLNIGKGVEMEMFFYSISVSVNGCIYCR